MYIDIHNHCLPQVDDGARALEESFEMLRISDRNGVNKIIVTPHYHYKRGHIPAEQIRLKTAKMNEYAEQQGINMQLYSGNEIYYCHDIVNLLENKQVLTMADSEYVLVEFPTTIEYSELRNGLYKLIMGGYHPILAHAERVETLLEEFYQLNELIGMGAYIQINITSVRTEGSHKVRKFVKSAIKNDMVHFLATDAHRASGRCPDMETDRKYIQKKYGEALLERTMYENPMKVISNEVI